MTNETKQTVVDKIVALLNKEGFAPVLTQEEIKSFKEMEKQKMIEFGCLLTFESKHIIEDCYNETYGGNK